jgi:CheY-like chemotaxis protein
MDKHTVFLVVDDFEPMRKLTTGQLRVMGVNPNAIVTANNGAEALRILRTQRVDFVLSDWNMPVMGGLELLMAIRADEKLWHLPFIMITAEADRHRIAEAIASGVSDLLVKPYSADGLASRIEKALASPPRLTGPVSPATEAASDVANAVRTGAAAPTGQATREPVSLSILVVDDAADNLELLADLFKDDYSVRVARNGENALALCQSNDAPDLVLLDIMMPGMDGFEVAQRMRGHPTSELIPVIFVTAMTDDGARLKGLELGAVDFVTKPVNPAVLRSRVRNFMRYVALRKQLQANYDDMMELARLRQDADHIMRHDLKGPLTGVIGMVQALAEDKSMSSRHVGQLRMIEDTAVQGLDMVNLSEELFALESGQFKLDAKPVRIGDTLRRIVHAARETFAEKRLTLVIDTDVPLGQELPQVLGDETFCSSLFQNLVKNACEAAPGRSRMTVTLFDETPLRVVIQNKGAVPVEIRDRFFEKFVSHGKKGGTGLGAYSAKMLAMAQNGAIALEVSDPENQTTLTVTLPRYSEATELKKELRSI